MSRVYTFLLISLFFAPKIVWADLAADFRCIKKLNNSSKAVLLKEMDRRFVNVKGFKANFKQESRMLAGTGAVQNEGTVNFKKPGKMNWRYVSPSQLFISNGETIWFYQPGEGEDDSGEVTLIDFFKAFSSETPGSFLLGLGSLSKDFRLHSGCETKAGYAVKLTPIVEDENLQEFYLLVRKWDNVAIGAKIVDFTENETIIRFYNIKTNPAQRESDFNFIIPKGVFVDDHRVSRSFRTKRAKAKESKRLEQYKESAKPKELEDSVPQTNKSETKKHFKEESLIPETTRVR